MKLLEKFESLSDWAQLGVLVGVVLVIMLVAWVGTVM